MLTKYEYAVVFSFSRTPALINHAIMYFAVFHSAEVLPLKMQNLHIWVHLGEIIRRNYH